MKHLFQSKWLRALATSALALLLVVGVAQAAITVTATNITGSTTLTLASTTTSAASFDSGTTGAVNLGTGNNAKTVNVGTGTAGNTINIGTNNTTADTVVVGSALDNVDLAGEDIALTSADDMHLLLTSASCILNLATCNDG